MGQTALEVLGLGVKGTGSAGPKKRSTWARKALEVKALKVWAAIAGAKPQKKLSAVRQKNTSVLVSEQVFVSPSTSVFLPPGTSGVGIPEHLKCPQRQVFLRP